MIITLNESRKESVKFISGEIADRFDRAIHNADLEAVKRYSMVLLEKCKMACPDNDPLRIEADALIMDFDDSALDGDAMNGLLVRLYDLCDDFDIIIEADNRHESDADEIYINVDDPDSVRVVARK